jgi:YegS/Rv2252/BmrU family lipid kinase
MSNDRPLIIVNPRSGGGRAGRTFAEVRAVLERRLGALEVAFTASPGHAIGLARDAVQAGTRLVVAVGGDGTLHEVANGVLDAHEPAATVGYVGQGTGGDFRKTLGIEHRLDAYVDAIASGRLRKVDAGRLTYRGPGGQTRKRWFINILSAGMGGLVDRYVSETTKALGGKAAYFWASTKALVACERGRLRCEVILDGATTTRKLETFMVAICNGRYFGSGMHVAPMAEPDDGRFEVVSMDAPGKVAFATFSRRIYDGSHLSSPGVQHFGCDRITIDLENERARDVFLLDVDGEPLGGLPLEVELVRGALTLRV